MSIDIVLRLLIIALGIGALSERTFSGHPLVVLIRNRRTMRAHGRR